MSGILRPLRTKAEVQASNETIEVYITEIPSRSASALLDLIKDALPTNNLTALQHLRRFVKEEYLPDHLKRVSTVKNGDDQIPPLATLHLLVCTSAATSLERLQSLFASSTDHFEPLVPTIRNTPVPLYAPTSSFQAEEWSAKYWPIVYKNTNPYGPHPAMVARAELELLADGGVTTYISLAREVATCAIDCARGERIGAVIVERNGGKKLEPQVVAVAGDGRYSHPRVMEDLHKKSTASGNAMQHAAMRAIAMVAEKRRLLEKMPSDVSEDLSDLQLNGFESKHFDKPDSLAPNGYLCLDLEIYLTHEPCVMCAMAILHSRFGRVIFAISMPKTGALSAELDSLGYGLFWRNQLNWKMLCWQWMENCLEENGLSHDEDEINEDTHA